MTNVSSQELDYLAELMRDFPASQNADPVAALKLIESRYLSLEDAILREAIFTDFLSAASIPPFSEQFEALAQFFHHILYQIFSQMLVAIVKPMNQKMVVSTLDDKTDHNQNIKAHPLPKSRKH